MTASAAPLPSSAPARPVRPAGRLLAAAALAAAALLLAFAAARTRAVGSRLLAGATVVGEVPAASDPADASAFAPFAFGVVGPVRGDTVALANAVEALAARGDARFVVLLGDVTSTGEEAEFLRIAAASRERGVDVVAVPGPADLARLDSFQSHVGAGRWWFLHRECAFVGLPGGDGDAAFVRDRFRPTRAPRVTIAFATAADTPPVAADLVLRPEPGVRVVRLDADARAAVESVAVPGGPSVRSLVRDASFGVLFPVVRGLPGFAAVLAAAGAALVASARLARR